MLENGENLKDVLMSAEPATTGLTTDNLMIDDNYPIDTTVDLATNKAFQNFIRTVTANCEDDYDHLDIILNPEENDEGTVGIAFEKTFGYNPMTFYTEKQISDMLNKTCEVLDNPDITKTLLSHEEDITNSVLLHIQANRHSIIYMAMKQTLEQFVDNADELDEILTTMQDIFKLENLNFFMDDDEDDDEPDDDYEDDDDPDILDDEI